MVPVRSAVNAASRTWIPAADALMSLENRDHCRRFPPGAALSTDPVDKLV